MNSNEHSFALNDKMFQNGENGGHMRVERRRDNRTLGALGMMIIGFIILGLMGAITAYKDSRDGVLQVPFSAHDVSGLKYQDVQLQLESAGFTNIDTEEDARTSRGGYAGEVSEVSINGKMDFSAEDKFPSDAKIVVRYNAAAVSESPPNEDSVESGSAADPTADNETSGSWKQRLSDVVHDAADDVMNNVVDILENY